jgi:hypothetical protein
LHAEGHRFDPGILQSKWIYISNIYKCLFFDFSINVAVLDLSGLMKFIKLIDQGIKGVWWMPWYREAMKGVANCDKPRGAVSRL